jgi:hypothetical protein
MKIIMQEKCGAPTYLNGDPSICNNTYGKCRWHKGWRASTTAVPARPEPNTVHHPAHYNAGSIEVIEAIEDWQRGWPSDLAFHLGNAIKYIARAGKKDDIVQDLKKARWYVDRALSVVESRDEAGR